MQPRQRVRISSTDRPVILVTGASRGIGLAIARALVRAGARVVFAARSLELLRAEVAAAGGDAIAVAMDVTAEASVRAAVDEVLRRFGRIDVIVNNAGNAGAMNLWAEAPATFAREMFEVHMLGSERVMRAVVPTMRAQGGGTIVNFASTVGWVPMPGAALYSAAKAAVVAFSAAARAELRPCCIDVRVFAPPHTSTEAGTSMPLDLPKIFAPEWVAEQFVRFLRGRRACALPGGNGLLLLVQRMAPGLAAGIMHRLGFAALAKLRADPTTGVVASPSSGR